LVGASTGRETERKDQGDDVVLDLSMLASADNVAGTDVGVTSGSDPSEWESISVDRKDQNQTCSDANAPDADPTAPAICNTEKK
jgi:hypothetical protein